MSLSSYQQSLAVNFQELLDLLKNARMFNLTSSMSQSRLNSKKEGEQALLNSLLFHPNTEGDFAKREVVHDDFEEFMDEPEKLSILTGMTSGEARLLSSKIQVDASRYDVIQGKAYKVLNDPRFSVLQGAGIGQRAFFGTLEGIDVKCLPGIVIKRESGYLVVNAVFLDEAVSNDAFAKASAHNHFFVEEALTREVLAQNDIEVTQFLYMGVSTVDWSIAGYFAHDMVALEQGFNFLGKALKKLNYCRENNIWSESEFDFSLNIFKDINEVKLPNYVFYQYGD